VFDARATATEFLDRPDCDPAMVAASRQVLRECGNLSSPSVLFALERALRDGSPDEMGETGGLRASEPASVPTAAASDFDSLRTRHRLIFLVC